jgi:hypothetical protein
VDPLGAGDVRRREDDGLTSPARVEEAFAIDAVSRAAPDVAALDPNRIAGERSLARSVRANALRSFRLAEYGWRLSAFLDRSRQRRP